MKTKDYIELEDKHGAHNYDPLDVVLSEGEGVWVTDVEGKKYMDFLACYSALNQGHRHPKIMKAFLQQAKKLTLTSRAFRNEQLPLLYKKLNEMTGFDMALPMNTGAEAVETAIKTARKWGYEVKGIPREKAEIIVAKGNFHGRTTTIVGFSDSINAYRGFGPYCKEAFPMHEYGDLEDLKSKITDNTAAILIEPIQGEAGVVTPPEGYLREIGDLCIENNMLFVCDEIQSGLGRTGKLFAYQHEDVRPDIVIIGKALGGGFYPVSAILADETILGVIKPGEHGSTFGGNPLGASIARTALEVLVEENMIENSRITGKYFMDKMKEIDSPHIIEVRGKGLWIGIELDRLARPYTDRLREEGLLCKETHENNIRFSPPLIITKEEIDWAVERIDKVIQEFE